MRKDRISLILCLGLALSLVACNTNTTDDTAADVGNTSVAESSADELTLEETCEEEQLLPETEWSIVLDQKFDFRAYIAGFISATQGITGGYGGEIHCTTDGGVNWPQSTNNSACIFTLDFVDENIIYAGGNKGMVTKSMDGGQNFSVVGIFTESKPARALDLSFCDEKNGIIASFERMGITKDGGITWTELEKSGLVACIQMVSAEELYYINDGLNLYRTKDGGSTWEEIPLNLPLGDKYYNGSQNLSLYVDGEGSYTVYCIEKGTQALKCYSTTDNCVSWTEYAMPEVTGTASLYLNKEGNVLTFYLSNETGAIVLVK